MNSINKQIIVRSYPNGWLNESDFELMNTPLATPMHGEVLIQNNYLSLDPYMRGRLSPSKSYAKSAALGEVMVGSCTGTVIESKSDKFKIGDTVLNGLGWQTHGVCNEREIKHIDISKIPEHAYLGVLGMPGVTAWTGLVDICEAKQGETVVVDAASGAVGSVVGQLAIARGCRVVGIAGGAEKCNYVVKELGFNACIDHQTADFQEQLKNTLAQGIDCLFENVGGAIFESLLQLMKPFSRIALCGLVSEYNVNPYGNHSLRSILINRIKVQGFIVTDKPQTWPTIIEELKKAYLDGHIKYKLSQIQGIENAPKGLIGLLKGENFGKQVVKLR